MWRKSKRVFLDHASTTPIDRRVWAEMRSVEKMFYNPSSLYQEGIEARRKLESYRSRVARILQIRPSEVIFTASGTESDNLAVVGTARAVAESKMFSSAIRTASRIKSQKKPRQNLVKKPHIITTVVEHVAVLEACRMLERTGFDVTYLPVDTNGLVSARDVENALRPETVLISIMLANNEIGVIMPIRKISSAILKFKKDIGRAIHDFPYFHTDASQAPNYLEVNLNGLGVDLLTLDGSKIYGPKGVGCLGAKSFVPVLPILYGGGQERGLRPGTENLLQVVGFARALELASELRKKESQRQNNLQQYFMQIISRDLPKACLNGSETKRLPNNINICIPGINAEFAVIQMDEAGIACSAMTACKNLSAEPSSYVIAALTSALNSNPNSALTSTSTSASVRHRADNCSSSSLRFTMGRDTKKRDIDRAVSALKKIIEAGLL